MSPIKPLYGPQMASYRLPYRPHYMDCTSETKKAVNRPTSNIFAGCYKTWPSLAPPYDPVQAPVAPGAMEGSPDRHGVEYISNSLLSIFIQVYTSTG